MGLYGKDLFMCIKKEVGVLTVQLVQAEERDEDEEQISIKNYVHQGRQLSMIKRGSSIPRDKDNERDNSLFKSKGSVTHKQNELQATIQLKSQHYFKLRKAIQRENTKKKQC